ncbi:hypothetical protein J6590_098372 [Homalodisca vitripennis]|nr:hypothetical protein J6590_098372 [Homalodisca vitripennis]
MDNPGGDAPWLQATGSGRRSRRFTSDLIPVTGPSERNTRKDLPCRYVEVLFPRKVGAELDAREGATQAVGPGAQVELAAARVRQAQRETGRWVLAVQQQQVPVSSRAVRGRWTPILCNKPNNLVLPLTESTDSIETIHLWWSTYEESVLSPHIPYGVLKHARCKSRTYQHNKPCQISDKVYYHKVSKSRSETWRLAHISNESATNG